MNQRLMCRSVSQTEIDALIGWVYLADRGGMIEKQFLFNDFSQAFSFMTQLALYAEKNDHHPEWFNVYDRVDISLTTHDVSGLSQLDLAFANHADCLYCQYKVENHD